jgi:hypothetical protein
MKKSHVSRRKFLTAMGLATGAVALRPAYKSLDLMRGNRVAGTSKTRPAFLAKFPMLKVASIVNRKASIGRMPLATRPV